MVKFILSFFFLVLSACTANIDIDDTSKLAIESVTFDSNGSFSGDISGYEAEEACKQFMLSEDVVKNFFLQSRAATEREYAHDLLASNCFSGGKLTTSQGRLANWKIDRARRGYFAFEDEDVQYFYCAECMETVYDDACDIDCIHE